jgi:ABC-type uncharacterized transport system ATPase subunit
LESIFKLKLQERFMISSCLPEKGNFVTLKIVEDLRKELSPSEEEIKNKEIINDDNTGSIRWNNTKDLVKEIKIEETAQNLIIDSLKKLNEINELTLNHLSLCDIFNISFGKDSK